MRKLTGSWLVLCICAGCASAQEQPPQQPAQSAPAPAAAAPATLSPDSALDDILDALDRRGKELNDFTANVTLADTDTAVGNETKLTGRILMQRLGQDDARLRVAFNRKEVNEKVTNDRQEFMLSGGTLTERNYVDATEIRRQVLQPGQKMNLLKLGEGPFPLPLGQDKADVHKMFEVKKFPPAADDPAGSIHVQLAPKKGSQFETRFSTIDFWVDPQSRMPVRIVTLDPNGTTQRTTELKEIKVNANLADKDFVLEPIDEKKWTIRSQAYDE
ncbi:MAG: hypothetical protein QOF78_1305 [Phycisphaerales bacterium]|nr:hypothetical protein [Phycisphaerales bacterium]MEA2735276.1 hypothetical protein [Humisphaera sp.]